MVLDDKIRIIGRSVVRKEARELKIMLDMLRHTCRDRAKSKELMGSTYMYSRDCLWHQQVSFLSYLFHRLLFALFTVCLLSVLVPVC